MRSEKIRGGSAQLTFVISMRVDLQRKEMLETLAKSTSRSVSKIMREAMDSWKANQQELYPNV